MLLGNLHGLVLSIRAVHVLLIGGVVCILGLSQPDSLLLFDFVAHPCEAIHDDFRSVDEDCEEEHLNKCRCTMIQ